MGVTGLEPVTPIMSKSLGSDRKKLKSSTNNQILRAFGLVCKTKHLMRETSKGGALSKSPYCTSTMSINPIAYVELTDKPAARPTDTRNLTMAEGRPEIAHPMKREVRQRCGFGCVICGLRLYTYEHMEGWRKVHRHVVSEITLLCDRHQRERTNGLLPLAAVRDANANPHNTRTGVSHPSTSTIAGVLVNWSLVATTSRGAA